jgi:hypothetical protein
VSPEELHVGLWNLPSRQLFDDFCDDLVTRVPHEFFYGNATSVQGSDGNFQVSLEDGRKITAATVVLGVGVPGPPVIPSIFDSLPSAMAFHTDENQGSRLAELNRHSVLVIGGGLTAVQAAQLAIKKNCKVVLCSRRPLTTRRFDVHASWFDFRTARGHHFDFYDKALEERLEHLKATRGGGSVPPSYMEDVRAKVAEGRLEIICGEAQIKRVSEGMVEVIINQKVYAFHKIVNACGYAPNCQRLPLIQEMLSQWPVDIVGGLPTLSQDLQWGDHKQLFLLGALAGLQVGPDAGNLMGIRRAAQRIVSVLGLRSWLLDSTSVLGNVRGNRYAALSTDCDSDSDEDVS